MCTQNALAAPAILFLRLYRENKGWARLGEADRDNQPSSRSYFFLSLLCELVASPCGTADWLKAGEV